MRLVPIASVKPGMKLGKSIYNEEGRVLLGENVELTSRLLSRLGDYGISYLYVQDSRTDDIQVEDIISEEVRIKALGKIRTTFRKMMDQTTKNKLAGIEHMGKTFSEILDQIIDDISSHKEAMVMLTNISITDHYLYHHSLNVCIYSTLLGMSYGYNRDQLSVLGLGALLHDIGKTKISQEILYKPGKLTKNEFAEIIKHTELGYHILKKDSSIPLIAAHCALQHHERLDGSGYPRGLKGDEIHDYAKWIGLVDVYDAMTTHRVYRPAMLPHQAMETLFTGSGTLFQQDFIEHFRDKVALYPQGMSVKLNNGETGVVVRVHAACPHRPVVRILFDAEGQELTQPYELDLEKKLSLMVTGINDLEQAMLA